MKEKLLTMRHTVISTVLLALAAICIISTASALEFSFDAPSSIKLKEEFTVKVYLSTSELYDVKAYVKDPNDKDKTLSEIYDDGWKSAYFFVKESFPSQTEFRARVTKAIGSFDICVKLRKAGKTTSNEKCSSIKVENAPLSDSSSDSFDDQDSNTNSGSNSQSESNNNNRDSEDNNNNQEDNKGSRKEKEENRDLDDKAESEKDDETDQDNSQKQNQTNYQAIALSSNQSNPEEEKIVLNSPNKDKLNSVSSFSTKEDSFRIYLMLAFSLFAVIITILLALRKL